MNNHLKITPQLGLRPMVRRFLIIFLPLAAILAGILAGVYYLEVRSDRAVTESHEIQSLDYQVHTIKNEFQSILSDLMYLSEQNDLLEMIESGEADRREALAEDYRLFSAKQGIYDQIRFLDETGMEVVRVNFNNGSPSIVPVELLQSKAKRYYFEDTIALEREEVFVSPFDLNIEQGEIEQPLKPMMRFGTPVSDRHGQKRGIVVLNYLGANLINDLKAVTGESVQFMLLNSDGFWLAGLAPQDEWGFMFEDKGDRTFGNDFPEAWQIISASESGQFYTANGMFTYDTVYPLFGGLVSSTGAGEAFVPSAQQLEAEEYYWKLISYMSSGVLNAGARAILGRFLLLYAGMLAVAAGSSWAMTRVSVRRKQSEETLRESEEKYHAIFTQARDGIVLVDGKTGNIVDCNPEFEHQTGRNLEQLKEMKIWEIRPPEKIEAAREKFSEIWRKGVGGSAELEFQKPDGEIVSVEFTSKRIKIQGRDYMQTIARDITERKRAEEEIGKFKAISDSAGYGAATASIEGEFLYLNEAYAQMHGYIIDELIGKHYSILYTEESLQDLERFRQKLLQKGAFFTEELWRRRKDNTIFPSLTTAVVVKDDKGNPLYTAATAIDITKRKQAEDALRESEERYRALLELSGEVGEAVVMLQDTDDKEAVHVFATGEWSRITGYSRKELLGMSWVELLQPDYREAALERYQRRMGGEVIPGLFEASIVRKDGTEVPVEITAGPTTYRGKFALVVYARDITGPKKADQEREKLIQELQATLQEVKTLSGLLPICAWCKNFRDDEGYWKSVEEYLGERTGAEFTHGICPECAAKFFDHD